MNPSDDIELIDVDDDERSTSATEQVSTSTRRTGGLAVAAVAAVALGVAALAGTGPEAPPTTEAPSTTEPPPPPRSTDGAVAEVDRGPTAFVGDGPELIWQSVDVDIQAGEFRWADGGFFALTPSSALLIEPTPRDGANTTTLEGTEPDRFATSSELVVIESSDSEVELLFLEPGQPRLALPPSTAPVTDLVTVRFTYTVERRDADVVVLEQARASLDVERFRDRLALDAEVIFSVEINPTVITASTPTGRERVPIDAVDLSPDDLAGLLLINEPTERFFTGQLGGMASVIEVGIQRADWIAVIDDDFLVGGSGLWRSSDGVDWEPITTDTPPFSGLPRPGPDGRINGLAFEADAGFFTSSTDLGTSWQRTARVLDDTWQVVTSDPIVAMTGWSGVPERATSSPERILTPTHELLIDQGGQTFELFDRSGSLLSAGRLDDPTSGFRFVPGAMSFDFFDPTTGMQLADIDLDRFSRSVAAQRTTSGDPQLIAVADLRRRADDAQEWGLAPITDVFGPDALAVDLSAGEGWLLADVLTETGRAIYLSEVPAAG